MKREKWTPRLRMCYMVSGGGGLSQLPTCRTALTGWLFAKSQVSERECGIEIAGKLEQLLLLLLD